MIEIVIEHDLLCLHYSLLDSTTTGLPFSSGRNSRSHEA